MINHDYIQSFFEPNSQTFSYIVHDAITKKCAIIDSVLNFDYASGGIRYDFANTLIAYVQEQQLEVMFLLETHVHADHLSAAPYLQQKLGGKIAISKHIVQTQTEFGRRFNEGSEFALDGSQFDLLFEEDQLFSIGNLSAKALYTPGHTPACSSYLIEGSVFVGDTLFMPDVGTARADFPGGNAATLYRSIQKILSLDSTTRIFVGHDYPPASRGPECESNVTLQKTTNIHLMYPCDEQHFISIREKRDRTLSAPTLMYPSIQINMRAGKLPPPEDNQKHYLKIPLSGIKG